MNPLVRLGTKLRLGAHGGHLLSVEQTVSGTNLSICVWLLHLVVPAESTIRGTWKA